jgi:hypothetical protein
MRRTEGRGYGEESPEVGLSGRPTVHRHGGVDEGEILPLLFGEVHDGQSMRIMEETSEQERRWDHECSLRRSDCGELGTNGRARREHRGARRPMNGRRTGRSQNSPFPYACPCPCPTKLSRQGSASPSDFGHGHRHVYGREIQKPEKTPDSSGTTGRWASAGG